MRSEFAHQAVVYPREVFFTRSLRKSLQQIFSIIFDIPLTGINSTLRFLGFRDGLGIFQQPSVWDPPYMHMVAEGPHLIRLKIRQPHVRR